MKRLKIKLYITITMFLLVSCLVFFCGYLFLSKNYVLKAAGNNFINMTGEVAVDFNLQITSGYNTFKNVVDQSNKTTVEERYQFVLLNKELIQFKNVNNIKIGYIDEENKQYYINDSFYNYGNQYIEKMFTQSVTFCNFSYILMNCDDINNYIVLRYKDILVFFESQIYGDLIFNSFMNNEKANYLVIDSNGMILFEKNNSDYFNKLYTYFDFLETETKDYQELSDRIKSGLHGYNVFEGKKTKQMFVYTPIVSDYNSDKLFICYALDYELVENNALFKETQNLLRNTLIIIFAALFVTMNAILISINVIYAKKEYEFSLSRLTQLFVKPYVVLVNKKGHIIDYNKAFRLKVQKFYNYEDVSQFNLYPDPTTDVLPLILKQTSFVIALEDSKEKTRYIKFISIKKRFKYCLIGEDKTEEVIENDFNRDIALYNPVTKLPNRYMLNRKLDELCNSDRLFKTNNSLIAIDITDFAKVNAIFGFATADSILCSLRDVLQKTLSDFEYYLYNIRTSLFVILLENVLNYNSVIEWSKQCLISLNEPIDVNGNSLTSVDVRIGIFNIETSKLKTVTNDSLYECAMVALERAKTSRHSKCSFYNAELGQLFSRDQIMEEDLRKAIDNNEFKMYYQTQYNTKYKRVVGFEALVRWDNPKYKFESVEHFISLAEKNGMIVEIGRIIIDQTFKFAKRIQDFDIHISMNVSPVQLLQSGFVNELIDKFNQYQLKKGSIAIEITETFLMENSDTMIEKIKLLRSHGFTIHLDDFGMGYSSLLYLKDLPIDLIKIDKQFVREMVADRRTRLIVSKIVQIATSLELGLVAEGVETNKQSEMLAKMGCNIIQGYLISKPIIEDEAFNFVKKPHKKEVVEDTIESSDDEFADEIELIEETEDQEGIENDNNTEKRAKNKKKGEDK